MKRRIEELTLVLTVPISIAFVEIVIVGSAVASGISSTDAVVEVVTFQRHMGIDSESAIGTTLQMGAHAALLFGACHNVDGTGKCLTAIHPAGSTLNHFNAFDVIHIHREVGSQMSRVGVTDVDAVE